MCSSLATKKSKIASGSGAAALFSLIRRASGWS
jgi:hypothetical protein